MTPVEVKVEMETPKAVNAWVTTTTSSSSNLVVIVLASSVATLSMIVPLIGTRKAALRSSPETISIVRSNETKFHHELYFFTDGPLLSPGDLHACDFDKIA